MRNIPIEKTELSNNSTAKTNIKKFKFRFIFLHFNFQIDTSLRKNFINYFSTSASRKGIFSNLKSNDPAVITDDLDTF